MTVEEFKDFDISSMDIASEVTIKVDPEKEDPNLALKLHFMRSILAAVENPGVKTVLKPELFNLDTLDGKAKYPPIVLAEAHKELMPLIMYLKLPLEVKSDNYGLTLTYKEILKDGE